LKTIISQFPPGVLQFEVGIQSFNEEVQKLISRRQDNAQTEDNLRWLIQQSNVHLHTDLIFGLPGETIESFADGFDRLWAIGPQEIQLGILKRLRGTPIDRHTHAFGMTYDNQPPYVVQKTKDLNEHIVQRFSRMAKYWDLVVNSGRFKKTVPLLMKPVQAQASSFWSFMQFSDALWLSTGKTYGLSPENLVDGIFDYLTMDRGLLADQVRSLLLEDYLDSGARARPKCLAQERLLLGGDRQDTLKLKSLETSSFKNRQQRHTV